MDPSAFEVDTPAWREAVWARAANAKRRQRQVPIPLRASSRNQNTTSNSNVATPAGNHGQLLPLKKGVGSPQRESGVRPRLTLDSGHNRRDGNQGVAEPTISVDERVNGDIARQQAVSKGEVTLQRFDEQVLLEHTQGVCPRGYRWYRCDKGYLCGGGNHYVRDTSIESLLRGEKDHLHITPVNDATMRPYDKQVVPPKAGWHEPMHWTLEKRIANEIDPIPLKADGTAHDGMYLPPWVIWRLSGKMMTGWEIRLYDAAAGLE